MERYTFLGVVLFTLIALGIALMLPGRAPEGPVYLPWQVERTAAGSSRVFGLELGRSTLHDAQQRFAEPYEVSLFAQEGANKVVEAYFDSVALSGLRARVVLVLALSQVQVEELYERGVRIANLGGGRHKVTLADADLQAMTAVAIASLTYIPKTDLSAELIEARFGLPAERVRESGEESMVEHWLYPQLGLDIALHEKGKEVLQYLPPARFEELRGPLLQAGEVVKGLP